MRKAFITGLIAAALMGVGLGFASPAQAAGRLMDNEDGTFTVASLPNDNTEAVHICASSVSDDDCAVAFFASDLLYFIQQNGIYGVGSTVLGPGLAQTTLPAGSYTIVVKRTGSRTAISALPRPFIMASGGDSSFSTTTSQPQPVALSINSGDGSSCRQSSESGFAGSWMNLPGADDCTAPATKPGATLLGWATTPNFPVDIAQRQVSNGWGAYEMVNDEGRLTAVFIPAGGATFLSGDGNLFAIWSK